MPKKKKKRKGKKKKGKGKKNNNEFDPNSEEGKKAKLIETAKRLQRQCKQEALDFNKFQQQRDQINYFWIVEKKSLEDKKTDRRNKERELQDLEEKHQVEIKVYKQSVKHLLFEHQDETTIHKTELERNLKLLEDDHRVTETQLKKDLRGLEKRQKEMEITNSQFTKQLKSLHDHNIAMLRHEFERRAREFQLKYEKNKKEIRQELEAEKSRQIKRIEYRKNEHTRRLMKQHEDAFTKIKRYYNDITHNNLDLIKSLKDDVSEMKKKERLDEKKMLQIAAENKRMSEPLKIARADVKRLKKEKSEYEQDKQLLNETKAKLLVIENRFRKLSWEHEVLEQRYAQSKSERDQMRDEYEKTIYNVKQKSGFDNQLIRKKISAVNNSLEQHDAQLLEVVSMAGLEGHGYTDSLDDIVELKNATVRTLQEELERLINSHNRSVQSYEQEMVNHGVPAEELGFLPKLLSETAVGEMTRSQTDASL